jgi:hypothetical protein
MPERRIVDEDELRAELRDAARRMPLDVDVERVWSQLRDEMDRDARTAARQGAGWIALVAACVMVAVIVRPVVVPIVVETVRVVRELVDSPPPTIAPEPTTLAPPTSAHPRATGDVAHSPILGGDAYRLTVRQVHDQINAAIGYGRHDLAQLDGAPERLEDLLGQDPSLDDELRTASELLRRARAEDQRDWAIYAHRIIEDIERQRASR